MENQRRFLSHVFCSHTDTQDNATQEGEETSIRHFYSILQPAPPLFSSVVHDVLQPEGLRATLLPFQRRSVKWLLEREFKIIGVDGRISPKPAEDPESLPLFWRKVKSPMIIEGKGKLSIASSGATNWWYFNQFTGSIKNDKPSMTDIAGAMLCEEMGLGSKTLECLALMLLSPATDRDPSLTHWDAQTELEVSVIKTNLIVTPVTLSQQWLEEIARHTPSLKVLFYTGYNKIKLPKSRKPTYDKPGADPPRHIWSSYLNNFDIVVTTYKTLQNELGVAKAPVVRPKRQAASYAHVEKPRSPLVRVEWARVFMDEVQLVGGGKTAEMVSLIPRKASIAVSGTPARSRVSDLSHVLRPVVNNSVGFLRVSEATETTKAWEKLLKPEFRDLFADLFRRYAIRTSKSSVSSELTIPPQRRFAVGIGLGKVEKLIYDQTLQEALDELGVDSRGVAASQDWEIDIGLLRNWLRRLRQICTHPQVGSLQRKKMVNSGTIKTMREVLQGLQARNWQTLIFDRRNQIQLCARRAQLLQKVDEELNRYHESRDLLQIAKTEVNQLVEDIKLVVTEHEEQGRQIKAETISNRRKRHAEAKDSPKGKGKAPEIAFESSADEYSEDDNLPHTRIGEEHRSQQRNLQARLREACVLQHKIAFLLGDVYHILENNIEEEESYAVAELVRRSLLKHSEDAATISMEQLSKAFHDMVDVQKTDIQVDPSPQGGIKSSHLMKEANKTLDVLNEQAGLIWKWRIRIVVLLTQKLSTSDGELVDGEEYARTLDTQGEVEAYLQAYTSLLADRKELLTAERTALATHNARETQLRGTFSAKKAAAPNIFEGPWSEDEDEGDHPQPEDAVILAQLTKERRALQKRTSKALRAVMFALNEITHQIGDRSAETQIAKDEATRLRSVITEQSKAMEKLELELASFRKVFNDRIQYFKQLQELSDTVVEVECKGDVWEAINSSKKEEESLMITINRKRAQARHLQSLAKDQEEGELEEAKDCVLCRSPFLVGLITPCAHIFCERCLMAWLKAMHTDCPVCRSRVAANKLQRISLDQDAVKATWRGTRGEVPPTREVMAVDRSIHFNTLPRKMLGEIQMYKAHGSYGSKIMQLIRHLLYLQNEEPGTKSVVFSAWSDSLTIIEQALISNKIQCIRVDQKGKQNAAQCFKTDPDLLVFLLHGERENAGLNLTCAKRVWLIEPTVNHSFEVQAISRVDRMGQTAATEVFCYYIEDTVEENILRMGAKRGFSLYVREHAADSIDISEFAMGSQKINIDSPSKKMKQKGDFIEKAEDLIHVLFPHLDYREDFVDHNGNQEYMDVESNNAFASHMRSNFINAVAGPSRLY
ncbi:hypothetical protein K439DRAFT_1366726 [Ramaria rubella]|nr:hypothetical protein K439DRAFT_1366726 [Ramaria rubella]